MPAHQGAGAGRRAGSQAEPPPAQVGHGRALAEQERGRLQPDRLHLEHTRPCRSAREVARKHRGRAGEIITGGDQAVLAIQYHHAVDQQEGVAVWQDGLDSSLIQEGFQ